ncbi:MAG: hypothetical protein IJF83_05640 [Methanobrevibacter sp.]|nr:hypothetical protein [Methanobrevibacter sp.]
MEFQKVKLRKDTDYVFCFKRAEVIEDEQCDYHEQNLKCDKVKDYFGRTHHRSKYAGYCIHGVSESILNECKYCLEKEEKYEELALSSEATRVYQAKHGKKDGKLFRLRGLW